MENRPVLIMMLEDAKKGLFKEIVVWKFNMLAKNHIDLLKTNEILESCGITFRSVIDPFDTSNPIK